MGKCEHRWPSESGVRALREAYVLEYCTKCGESREIRLRPEKTITDDERARRAEPRPGIVKKEDR